MNKLVIFGTHMVDFHRPGHIYIGLSFSPEDKQ